MNNLEVYRGALEMFTMRFKLVEELIKGLNSSGEEFRTLKCSDTEKEEIKKVLRDQFILTFKEIDSMGSDVENITLAASHWFENVYKMKEQLEGKMIEQTNRYLYQGNAQIN